MLTVFMLLPNMKMPLDPQYYVLITRFSLENLGSYEKSPLANLSIIEQKGQSTVE